MEIGLNQVHTFEHMKLYSSNKDRNIAVSNIIEKIVLRVRYKPIIINLRYKPIINLENNTGAPVRDAQCLEMDIMMSVSVGHIIHVKLNCRTVAIAR